MKFISEMIPVHTIVYRFSALLTASVLVSACASTPTTPIPDINLGQIAQSADGTFTTEYRAGDKPVVGCTINSGYTLLAKGTADGEVCDEGGGDATVTASGADDEGDELLAYQSCGTNDCQVSVGVPSIAEWSGNIESFTTFGVEICEGASDAAWCMRAVAYGNGTLRCKAGTPGPDDYNVTGTGAAPSGLMVTHDDDLNELRCLQSSNGSDWTTFGTYSRALAEPAIGGIMATSHSETATSTALLTDLAFGTTITGYTPSGPPSGSPPTQTSSIGNQTGTQGVAFSLNISGNFTGETSYSASGLPGSTGLSFSTSTGILSGTPTAADVSASPYNLNMCGVNADGSTCQSVQFTFSVAPPGNTVNWATSAPRTRSCEQLGAGPGDTIVIKGTTSAQINLNNCIGTADSPIRLVNDTAESGPLVISGSRAGIIELENVRHLIVDGTGKWSGASGNGCGMRQYAPNIMDGYSGARNCGIVIRGTSTTSQGIKPRGNTAFVTVKGVEIDGDTGVGIRIGISGNDKGYELPASVTQLDCINGGVNFCEWREGMIFDDNYVHDTITEALYIGANANATALRELPTRDNHIIYNIVENSGYDALSLKSVIDDRTGRSSIAYNWVTGAGTSFDPQSEGNSGACADVFEGGYVDFHDNVLRDCFGPGIVSNSQNRPAAYGPVTTAIWNNVIVRAGYPGNNKRCMNFIRQATADMEIRPTAYNNTCIDPTGGGVQVESSISSCSVRNNIFAGAAAGNRTISASGCTVSLNENSLTTAQHNFVDDDGNPATGSEDYRLTSSSPARNTGTNTPCPSEDLVGTSRPQGGTCDKGALEFDE